MRNEPGAPHDRGQATVSSPGSRQQQSRGRKRSHPSDAMDDGAPPNVKLPTAVSPSLSLSTTPLLRLSCCVYTIVRMHGGFLRIGRRTEERAQEEV